MNDFKYTEKLARVILAAIAVTVAFFALKYFGTIVGYIVASLIVALIAKPLVRVMRKIKIRGKQIPDGVLAIVAILLILGILCGMIAGLVPVFAEVVRNISAMGESTQMDSLSMALANLNELLRETFRLQPDFKVEVMAMDELSSLLNFSMFGNVIGQVASTVGSIGVGLFSVIFIAFFLIKDEKLFANIIRKLTPARLKESLEHTLQEVEYLLSRYFVGLLIEMAVVGLIDFVGLWSIAGLEMHSALGVAFMACILNIIPYIGPLIGTVLGSLMAVALSYSGVGASPEMSLWLFLSISVAIFLAAQAVDNIVLQPLIYSTSVKAHPLEIFIVLLIAGTVGGMVGMLLGIPAYTVIRVVAINFFPDSKLVKAFYK